MIISEGPRRAAFRTDEPTAAYRGVRTVRRVRAGTTGSTTGTTSTASTASTTGTAGSVTGTTSTAGTGGLRVVVEVSRQFSGMTLRALLGAAYTPDRRDRLAAFEVPVGTALGTGAATTCVSELGGFLAPGLPADFAPAVLDALAGDKSAAQLPAGTVRIDRAGFDAAGSGELAFRLAAQLLRRTLAARLNGDDAGAAVRAALRSW